MTTYHFTYKDEPFEVDADNDDELRDLVDCAVFDHACANHPEVTDKDILASVDRIMSTIND